MKRIFFSAVIMCFFSVQLSVAQEVVAGDTVAKGSQVYVIDTAETVKVIHFNPNPQRAVLYSALVPGLGQIYNRKYWKLPFVYAGYAALVYAISWNGKYYNQYKKAYVSIADTDPLTNDYVNYIPSGEDVEAFKNDATQMAWFTDVLKTKQLAYRSNRDLSIIGIIGFYGMTLLDAYVDAQLYDFDISPDLSMHVEPVLQMNAAFSDATIGLRCQFNF